MFFLEVRSAAGTKLCQLLKMYDVKHEQAVNEAGTLSFSVRHNNPAMSQLTHANWVWLRDENRYLIGKFRISKRTPTRDTNGAYWEIVCQDALAQLGREVLDDYDSGPTSAYPNGKTVTEIVSELLNGYQYQTPKITIGEIDPVIGNEIISSYTPQGTILSYLKEVQDTLDLDKAGYFFVDSDNRFRWLRWSGWQRGQVFATGHNVQVIRRTERMDGFYTRLVIFGEGEDPVTRLKLTDCTDPATGLVYTHEYMDAASSVISTYGIWTKLVVDKTIVDPETLWAKAKRLLSEQTHPPYEWSVTPVDRSQIDDEELRIDAAQIFPGSIFRIRDEELGFDDEVYVVKVTRNLDKPLVPEIQLGTRTTTLVDHLQRIYRKLDPPLRVATCRANERYPRIGRTFPDDWTSSSGSAPYLFEYKNCDMTNSSGVIHAYSESDSGFLPLGVWVPYAST
jgi:phage minor structural protein